MKADDRRTKILQMAAGAVFLAVAAVLVLIVVNASSGDGGDTKLEDVNQVSRNLRGIPQDGLLLGDPKAPVELIVFGDLQCPVCAAYSEEILSEVIEDEVVGGLVKIDFRNFTIIGPESVTAGAAALAAGAQGRGWNFLEIFYRNQGSENSGYAEDPAFLKAVAKAAGVKDIARWNRDRASLTDEVEETTEQAQGFGFEGTPSLALRGPGTDGVEPIETFRQIFPLEIAIEKASRA
jgi:protein-disulfide isomerase